MVANMFLTRGRLPISSFLCFIGGFSMGSWMTLFHQIQVERDLSSDSDDVIGANNPYGLADMIHSHDPLLLLVVMVISAPKNFNLRDTLRSTWLKLNPSVGSVKHFFVIGVDGLEAETFRRLKQENAVEGDLILLPDLIDSYHNLTLKVSRGLAHLSASNPYRFVLKTDDDSFVRLDALVREMEGLRTGGKCLYWGFFDGRARVQRRGKWKETEYNLCDLYLPYALGGGYVLSKKCSDFIIRNAGVLRGYNSEDVSVGTWLASIDHEKRHDSRFDTEFESRGCSNTYLVQHKISEAEMRERYTHLIHYGVLCPKEFRKRPAYEYQWQLPPSQCCKRNDSVV